MKCRMVACESRGTSANKRDDEDCLMGLEVDCTGMYR